MVGNNRDACGSSRRARLEARASAATRFSGPGAVATRIGVDGQEVPQSRGHGCAGARPGRSGGPVMPLGSTLDPGVGRAPTSFLA